MQSNILIYVVVVLCYIDLAWAFTGPSAVASSYQTIHCKNNKASSKINLPRHRHNSIQYATTDNDIDTTSTTNTQTNDSNSPTNVELSTSEDDIITKVGSSEYYQGFWSRSVIENQEERVTGDAVLGPTLKLAGGISLILVGLIGAFLVSNGLI